MIKSIQHKGLRLLWEEGNGNKLPADLITRIEIMLEVIDSGNRLLQILRLSETGICIN